MSDNLYVNISIPNNGGETLPSCRANIQYEQALIDNPSEYYMAITKFEIPLGSLPIMVFPDTSPEDLFVLGVCGYSESLSPVYPSNDQAVVYNNYLRSPADPLYYYIYSYEYWINLLNTALLGAWTAAGSPGGAGNHPYFVRDCVTNLIEIVLPAPFINDVSVSPNGWTVYWNTNVQIQLQSFNVQRSKSFCTNDPASNRFELLKANFPPPAAPYNPNQVAVAPYPTTPVTYKVCQEFQTNDYINSIRKIIITSNSLPIDKEIFPPSINAGDGVNFNNIPIITDFQLDLNNVSGAQRTVALFEAQIYQLIDLVSDQPLKSIGIEIYWVDKGNNIYPLPLLPYDNVSLKLGFFRKDSYKREH